MVDFFTENLHYLLWAKEEKSPDRWRELLASWVGCDGFRSLALLRGAFPSPEELKNLKASTGIDEETLRFTRLLKPDEILWRNIDYLFGGLEHGKVKEFVENLGVDASTVSRWRRGIVRPSRSHVMALAGRFSLSADTNLEETPLFLSRIPISTLQRREWLKSKLDRLPSLQLNEFFPALSRLLGDFDGTD
jgi:transcriptional regulator with XRE-family HTH domain